MKQKFLRLCFLILILIPILMVSCIHSKKREIEKKQTPKEQFLSEIVDLGGLIGENQNLILSVLDKYKVYDSSRVQNSDLDLESVKVIKVNLKKQSEYFWFVDGTLTEIHIPVGVSKVFRTFSSTSSVEEIKNLVGKPSSEYDSCTDPEILSLMFNSENFSLNFIFSNKDLDENISVTNIKNRQGKIIHSRLKEIRLTPSSKRPIFIGILEKNLNQSSTKIFGFNQQKK
jgi:hypothetical protein